MPQALTPPHGDSAAFSLACAGTLVRQAEVLSLPAGGVNFVVELCHTPPIVAVEHYPGGPGDHAGYIAATSRARQFRAGTAVVISNAHELDTHAKWHGRPCWQLKGPVRIAALDLHPSKDASDVGSH